MAKFARLRVYFFRSANGEHLARLIARRTHADPDVPGLWW